MTTTDTDIQFGLMPPKDYETMCRILDAVCERFDSGIIKTLELGVHYGNTSRGIHKFFQLRERINFHTGIDNGHDVPPVPPFEGCHMIVGNTFEVYNQIENNSIHFCLVDANHSYPMTVLDFWLYCKKIKIGGLIALHDMGAHIKPFTDYQHIGNKEDRDMYISCRKAADDLGLLNDRSYVNGCQFEKLLDVADPTPHTGGILCLKRIM